MRNLTFWQALGWPSSDLVVEELEHRGGHCQNPDVNLMPVAAQHCCLNVCLFSGCEGSVDGLGVRKSTKTTREWY